MKNDIILAGVGGQGILTISAVLGLAALNNNLHIKQSEVHGMSQRGGAVQSHLRISDKSIFSDLIPLGNADIILSVEPMEGLRYLPWLKLDGCIISNSQPFVNIPIYPDCEEIYRKICSFKSSLLIDADKMASELKSVRYSNIVMLGALIPYIDISFEEIEKAVSQLFFRKGEEIVQWNLKALSIGYTVSQESKNKHVA